MVTHESGLHEREGSSRKKMEFIRLHTYHHHCGNGHHIITIITITNTIIISITRPLIALKSIYKPFSFGLEIFSHRSFIEVTACDNSCSLLNHAGDTGDTWCNDGLLRRFCPIPSTNQGQEA